MTNDMMNLRSLVEKSADADLLRGMIGFAAEKLTAPEVGAATGAGYGEKTTLRLAQRNRYRDRDWETRAGTVELRITCARGISGVKKHCRIRPAMRRPISARRLRRSAASSRRPASS